MRRKLIVFISIFLMSVILILPLFLFPAPALADTWERVASGGIGGDFNQTVQKNPECSIQFGTNLYVGTYGQVWEWDGTNPWTMANTNGFGDAGNSQIDSFAIYGGNLYAGTFNSWTGCEVWEWDGTNPWSQVNSDGFGDANNTAASSMAVYGTNLYVVTQNPTTGCEVWEWDGTNPWSQVNTDGFGDANNTWQAEIIAYGSDLYVGASNSTTGCEVWEWDGTNPWTQLDTDGFGDANNYGIYSAATFGGNLYMGTYNGSTGCEVWGWDGTNPWSQVNSDGFGESRNFVADSMAVYGGDLYVGTYVTGAPGCELWAWDGTNPWAQANTDGFGDSYNYGAKSMAVFGTDLCVATYNAQTGCEVWDWDGTNPWAQVNVDGFTGNENLGCSSMAVYNGDLYAGTYTNNKSCDVWAYNGAAWSRSSTGGFGDVSNKRATSMALYAANLYVGTWNQSTGCEVWEWDGTNPWSQVNTDGFGDNNVGAASMAAFNGKLYVGTYKHSNPCEVWEWDGATWGQVNTDGFGDANNIRALSMAVYGTKLYVGTYNSTTGCEVWEWDGTNPWSQVNANGFAGNNYNQQACSMAVYGANLYVGTYNSLNGCEVWEWDGTNPWSKVNTSGFGDPNHPAIYTMAAHDSQLYVGTSRNTGGCEVWKYDGTTWNQANTDGFGDTTNNQSLSMAVYGYRLYAGTYNATNGCEVWRNAQQTQPAIASVGPVSAQRGDTLDVDIVGTNTNFSYGRSAASFSGIGITVNSTTVTDATHATANITIASDAPTGARDVDVFTGWEMPTTLSGGFTVVNPPPDVTGTNPSVGYRGQTMDDVQVTGSDFRNVSTTVELKRSGEIIVGTDVTWVSVGELTCDFAIPAGATLGSDWDVYVRHNDDSKSDMLVDSFTVDQLTVDASATGVGGAVDPATQEVDWGGQASIGLIPDEGYHVESITDNGAQKAIADPYVINNVQEDHNVVVTFAPDVVPTTTWYLAEGCTGGDFETWVLVQNPGDTEVTVDLTFMTSAGPQPGPQGFPIPANSRQSFSVNSYVTDYNVSTKVEATGNVICERAMYGGGRTWAHDSIGVTAPADTWYLAEGCTGGDFETWVLVQNPGDTEVTVDLTFMTSAGPRPGPQGFPIPANSRQSFSVNSYVTDYNVSTKVEASGNVICERAMYGGGRTWAHDSIGVTTPADTWYLAEGCTGGDFETWVLVQNPNEGAVTVDLTFMTSAGPRPGPQGFPIPANSRQSFSVNSYVTDYNVSTKVEASGNVICERAMYGGGRTWAHDSIGVTTPADTWYLAEGCTGGDFETWVLVQNPNEGAVTVDLTFMTSAGPRPGPQGFPIPANSRQSFSVNSFVTDYNVSTKVEATGNVICERAMYGGNRTWAHDSIGYAP